VLTCGFASHHASCTVAQHFNSTMPWEQGGWARVRALARGTDFVAAVRLPDHPRRHGPHRGLVGPATADLAAAQSEIGSRPQARRGGTVSATVLHMSEVRELWEGLYGA